jgi:hypothetical protein
MMKNTKKEKDARWFAAEWPPPHSATQVSIQEIPVVNRDRRIRGGSPPAFAMESGRTPCDRLNTPKITLTQGRNAH